MSSGVSNDYKGFEEDEITGGRGWNGVGVGGRGGGQGQWERERVPEIQLLGMRSWLCGEPKQLADTERMKNKSCLYREEPIPLWVDQIRYLAEQGKLLSLVLQFHEVTQTLKYYFPTHFLSVWG